MTDRTNTYYWSVLLALTTVLFWSLSAPGAKFVRQEANYLGLTLIRMGCGALVFSSWLVYDWENTQNNLREFVTDDDESTYRFVATLVLFGIFLLIYDVTFFFSIQEGPSVPANVINYLWPLFFPALGGLVFRRSDSSFGWFEMGVLSLAFAGAALIAVGSTNPIPEGGIRFTYLIAFVAAVSAAVYMNLLSIAQDYVDSTPLIFFSAVLVALFLEIGIVLITDLNIEISFPSLPFLLLFGLSTFGLAQFAWGKAINLGEDVLISSISYLTPILSTIFLSVFVDAPITESVAFGAVLIIVAQVMLNDTFRHMTSLGGAFITIFLSSLYLYIDPSVLGGASSLTQINSLIGTIFAILTGFMLERVWETNRTQDEKLNHINEVISQIITKVEDSEGVEDIHGAINELVTSIIDLNYARSSDPRGELINNINNTNKTLQKKIQNHIDESDEALETDLQNLDAAVSDWLLMSQKRVTRGELAILSLLGAATIASLTLSVGDAFLPNLVVIGVNAVIVFSILKIRDYDYDRSVGSTKIFLEQQNLNRINKPLYFPDEEFTYAPEIGAVADKDRRINVGDRSQYDSDEDLQTVSDLTVRSTVRNGVLILSTIGIGLILILLYMQTA